MNGYLEEDEYIQSGGFDVKAKEDCLYRLKKVFYGLKQAPRIWYALIDVYFLKCGFKRSKSKPALYLKRDGNNLIVCLYVDDLIYTSSNSSERRLQKGNN